MDSGFDWSSFIEVPGFLSRWEDLDCDDADLRELQMELLSDPVGWPVVPGAGGWRKARFVPSSWYVGKSGALRVYYADLSEFGIILLGTAFAKSETTDLKPKYKRQLAELLDTYRKSLKESQE